MRSKTLAGPMWVALALGWAGAAGAQAGLPPNVIETPLGRVEVLGLDRWTIDQLQDSLRAKGYDLREKGVHACGAVLRYQLHFADAAAVGARDSAGARYWLVTVTEPGDSARIHHVYLPLDTAGGRPEWADERALVKAHGVAWPAVSAAHATPADEGVAIQALRTAPNLYDRLTAMAILAGFPQDDSAWAQVSQSILESDGPVQGAAVEVLQRWIKAGRRPHDWRVVAPAVHAVFDGTSEFMMPSMLTLVGSLPADTSLARPFLAHGGTMLLAYAGSHLPWARQSAIIVLRALSGKDYGTNVDQWRAWARSLD